MYTDSKCETVHMNMLILIFTVRRRTTSPNHETILVFKPRQAKWTTCTLLLVSIKRLLEWIKSSFSITVCIYVLKRTGNITALLYVEYLLWTRWFPSEFVREQYWNNNSFQVARYGYSTLNTGSHVSSLFVDAAQSIFKIPGSYSIKKEITSNVSHISAFTCPK